MADNDADGASPDVSSGEILDEMITRRGELKHRSVSFNDRQQLQVCDSLLHYLVFSRIIRTEL